MLAVAELLAWPAVALLHAVEPVAWLAVELLHPVRIGGRWSVVAELQHQAELLAWPVVFTRRHCWPGRRPICWRWLSCWPGRRSHCCTRSSRLPAVAPLHVVELVAWLAVELLHLVRIGGRWWLSCGTRSSL